MTTPREEGAFDIHLVGSNLTLTVPPDKSILDVVEQAGVAVLSSCRSGTCGTCATTVFDGHADHRDTVLSDDERQRGDTVLICVSRSLSALLTLDL